jgi:uncharacterized protein (TIGR02594 family)
MNNFSTALELTSTHIDELERELAQADFLPGSYGLISSYDQSLRELLEHEGGYSNHPADPGGPTKYGITIHDVRMYVKKNATAADVQALSLDTAKRIYRQKYWDVLRCSDLPAGVDYAVFDFGVNSGVSRAAKFLQRIVGVEQDGEIGPLTLAAVRKHNSVAIVTDLCDDRLAFLKGLRTWSTFGRGWGRRVAEVRTLAIRMAQSLTVGTPSEPSTPKAPQGLFGLLISVVRYLFGNSATSPLPSTAPAPQNAPVGFPGAPKWLLEARKDLGFKEKPGNRGIEGFIREASVGALGNAWCAIFVNAKLEECGIAGTRSAMARSFERNPNFVRLPGPALGAIATFWRGSPGAGTGHVNFYNGTDRGKHIGVGGNQSDGVTNAPMDMARHTGWWWPKSVPLPKIGPVPFGGTASTSAGSET